MKVAAHYFEKAARMGHGPSQRNLGIIKGMGDGIEKDIPSAYAWLRIATVNKDPIAPEALKDLTQGMTARQIELGHERAVTILNRVASSKKFRFDSFAAPLRTRTQMERFSENQKEK